MDTGVLELGRRDGTGIEMVVEPWEWIGAKIAVSQQRMQEDSQVLSPLTPASRVCSFAWCN